MGNSEWGEQRMLTIEKINVYYGAIHAIKDVSIHVNEGEIVSLIGANGAGKTSILRTISGLNKTNGGKITFNNEILYERVEKSFLGRKKLFTKVLPPHKIVEMGIGHVPEGRRVFPHMTVKENLLMGAYTRNQKDLANVFENVFTKFPRLKERIHQPAATLSGGEQQMLAMGRALMNKPKLLLMDEPSMGLAPMLVEEIFNIIKEVNKAGTTILLVEQNAHLALSIANRGYVIETGEIVMEGDAKDLEKNPEIRKAYLGE